MDGFQWSLDDWRFVAAVIATIIVIAIAFERLMVRMLHRLQAAGTLAPLPARMMRRAIQWAALLFVVLAITSLFPQKVGDLWKTVAAVFAVAGVVFVASWSSLSNVTAGFIIMIWRPFRIGDRIELPPDGPAGRVDDINTMFTVLRADDGSKFAVPNNLFLQRSIKCSQSPPTGG
jgi:small-conductance mechanosensitive channel